MKPSQTFRVVVRALRQSGGIVAAFYALSPALAGEAVSGSEKQAITAVRPLVAKYCSSHPCSFVATRSGEGWQVYVGYPMGDPPREVPGAFTVFLLDKNLKVIKR